jgi:hypothetical protein
MTRITPSHIGKTLTHFDRPVEDIKHIVNDTYKIQFIMPRLIFPVLLFLLSMYLLQSCAQLRETVSDEEVAVVEESPDPDEPEVGITGLPDWYDAALPVQITRDSVIVSAAAVAPDSSDARSIAELAAKDFRNKALTEMILLYLHEEGVEVITEASRSEGTDERRNRVIKALTLDEGDMPDFPGHTETVFWHQENGQTRCYIRHAFDRSAVARSIHQALQQ